MSSTGVVGAFPDVVLYDSVPFLAKDEQGTSRDSHRDLYIPILDGVRAIAFLLVFVAHAGLYNLVPGGFGVTVFFFLSGYLITTLLRTEAIRTDQISLSRFYIRRAFRILPPMYVTLAVAYLIGATGILKDAGNLFGFLSVSGYFFNYADLFHARVVLPTGTGVLWSLMVEEHFYLIFPFVYLYFIRHKFTVAKQVKILLGCCFAALLWRLVLIYVLHTPTGSVTFPRWSYSASEARFDSILFGCILAIRNNFDLGDASPVLKRRKGILAIGGVAVIAATLLIREPHFRETFRYTLQSMALYPIFYYCISSSHAWQVSWMKWKPLRYLGWISYSMYLFHDIPLTTGERYFHSHRVIVAIGSFPLALLFSWLMRIFVELPSRRWRSNLERRISARA